MTPVKQITRTHLLVVFLLGILTDVIFAACTLSITRGHLILAMFFCFLIPYSVLVETAWFADAVTLRDRLRITTAAAAGSALGTGLVMLTFGPAVL